MLPNYCSANLVGSRYWRIIVGSRLTATPSSHSPGNSPLPLLRKGLQPALGHGEAPQQEQVRLSSKPLFRWRQRQRSTVAVSLAVADAQRCRRHDSHDAPRDPGGRLQQSGDVPPQLHCLEANKNKKKEVLLRNSGRKLSEKIESGWSFSHFGSFEEEAAGEKLAFLHFWGVSVVVVLVHFRLTRNRKTLERSAPVCFDRLGKRRRHRICD